MAPPNLIFGRQLSSPVRLPRHTTRSTCTLPRLARPCLAADARWRLHAFRYNVLVPLTCAICASQSNLR